MTTPKRPGNWSRRAKAVGRDAENDVVAFLRSLGVPAERRRLTGCEDCGDIAGWDNTVVSVKALKTITLASIVDELEEQAGNAVKRGLAVAPERLAIIKRRGKSQVYEWYAVMPAGALVALLLAVRNKGWQKWTGTDLGPHLQDGTQPHGLTAKPD